LDTLPWGGVFQSFSSPWGVPSLYPMTHSTVPMSETLTRDRVTIQEAAQTLNIGRKTIYRWIDKGLLSREKEGNRAYVSLAEVRALCDRGVTQQDTESVSSGVSGNVTDTQQGTWNDTLDTRPDTHKKTNTATVEVSYLEGLLVRLGQLEAEKRYLLEYKTGIEAKDKELIAIRSSLDANSLELDQARATITKARNELQKLLEIKQDAEAKAKALLDKERELTELRAENTRLKRPWWEKIWKK